MPDIPDFTNHLFLWHLTPRRNADRIADQGFVPKGERRDGDPARPVWFSHSAFSFVQHIQQEKNRADYDGFLIALPIASLADWDGHAPDEFWVNVDAYLAVQRALVLVVAEAGFAGPIS